MATLNEDIGGDVQSVRLTASGTAVSSPARVRAVQYADSGTAGTVTLKDGGSGGTTLHVFDGGANGDIQFVPLPGAGTPFDTDVYVNIGNANAVTVIYQ